jgi:hypothetical protein
MIIRPYESKYRLAAKHAKIMRERRAAEGYKSSEQQVSDALKEMGQFFESSEMKNAISPVRASDLYEDFKAVYFSLCNPYKVFTFLKLKVIETYGVHNDRAVYAVWDDNRRWNLLEVGFFTEYIELKRIA